MKITIKKAELESLIRKTVFEILAENVLLLNILRNDPEETGMTFDDFLGAIDL